MRRFFVYIISLLLVTGVQAQFFRSLSPDVRSLRMSLNDDDMLPPVLRLGSDDALFFSFDELSHEYRRYTYRVEHCDASWRSSELFEIDYIDGFNDMPVDEWENSVNTTVQYTTYTFCIPNDDISLKLSGNYKLLVIDDESDSAVAEYFFSVLDERVALSGSVSGNTEIDLNSKHQQVSFSVHHPRYDISNPRGEIKAVVYQNRRMDNCVSDASPTYITGAQLQYVNNEKLIFKGGNEYRRFELTDTDVLGANVERVDYVAPCYHAALYPDRPTRFHSNVRDENGRFFVNTLDGYGTDSEADYVYVHFTLDAPLCVGGSYYLTGDFCGNGLAAENKLVYDEADAVYRATALLKMGLYNYSYVWVPDSSLSQNPTVEGDFYNTDNEYLIYIYHREFGARYDKLIGVGRLDYKLERN